MNLNETFICGCITLSMLIISCSTQDYDVRDIQCAFQADGNGAFDSISAVLRKPAGFKGVPMFADDRSINPGNDRQCIIETDPVDEMVFHMKVNDFSKCGVLKRNGYIHVRVWFPQFSGVVMQSDQELIIMCKPPEPTVIENKAAGFAGSFPNGARVSGVVEETPGRLEYEVALYKEALPAASMVNGILAPSFKNHTQMKPAASSNQNEVPLDQAVPIGTKLQLRARINTMSVWKYVKLLEVYVSPDPDNPHASGSVALVRNGCRNMDLQTILPHQPAKYRERSNEVFLDFEAFLLSSVKERSTLWIHSQIKACMDANDCLPEFCMDIDEPSGHGRRRKRHLQDRYANSTEEYTRFKENIEYTVIVPGAYASIDSNIDASNCRNITHIAILLSVMLIVFAILACGVVLTILKVKESEPVKDTSSQKGYAGRATVQ